MAGAAEMLTFLFSDIEGSTARWAEDADAMAKALAQHDATLRAIIDAHGGEVFKHTGDGLAAVFGSADEAVAAALEAQARVTLPVRIGLHSGPAEARDGDWFGVTVNRAARIMDAGHGGQVLCSARTAELLDADLPRRLLGEFVLKGIDRPERMVQVCEGSFPPLRAPAVGTKLPEPRHPLVGRWPLLDDVEESLRRVRLTTLLGPGGVGKTSLAVELGRRVAGRFDRISFVDLATIDRPGAAVRAFADALSLSSDDLASIQLSLASTTALLIVDNCEHVVGAAAELVDRVLDACPGVTVLATSREALELEGEAIIAVPPLDDDTMVDLFLARASIDGAAATDEDRAQILELCRRLDGLPLAIELAAARTSLMSVGQLLERIGDRFEVLGAGRRRARDRHRTLRQTVEWSYELLDDAERRAYCRLAVFTDWFDLPAAAAVVAAGDEYAALDALEALHGKSLLVVDQAIDRYRYLESIRDHAWEHLDASGNLPEVMEAMIDHLTARTRAVLEDLAEVGTVASLIALHQLLPLRRRALDWCAAQGDLDRAAALIVPFARLPASDARFVSGTEAVLALPGARSHPAGVCILAAATLERMYRQDFRAYAPAITELRQLAGSTERLAAEVGHWVAFMATIAADHDTVSEILAARMAHPHLDPYAHAWAIVLGASRGEGGAEAVDEILLAAEQVPSQFLRGVMYSGAAQAALLLDPDRTGELADRSMALLEPESSAWLAAAHPRLGWHVHRGDLRAALEESRRVADIARRLGERSALVPSLAIHALVLQALGKPTDAAVVRGALPRRWTVYYQRERDALDAWLAEALPPDRLAALAERGRSMELDELLAIAPAALERAGSRGQ